MMMKELEESNRFKMVEERKTQGFLESICGEGRGMMIFGDGDVYLGGVIEASMS